MNNTLVTATGELVSSVKRRSEQRCRHPAFATATDTAKFFSPLSSTVTREERKKLNEYLCLWHKSVGSCKLIHEYDWGTPWVKLQVKATPGTGYSKKWISGFTCLFNSDNLHVSPTLRVVQHALKNIAPHHSSSH